MPPGKKSLELDGGIFSLSVCLFFPAFLLSGGMGKEQGLSKLRMWDETIIYIVPPRASILLRVDV